MWKNQQGRLVQTTDMTRVRYKTRIRAGLLEELKALATEHDTHIGYLLESGYEALLEQSTPLQRVPRPNDRIEFRTTCDAELLASLKQFAKEQHMPLNEVIESSIAYINPQRAKQGSWRYRIE